MARHGTASKARHSAMRRSIRSGSSSVFAQYGARISGQSTRSSSYATSLEKWATLSDALRSVTTTD